MSAARDEHSFAIDDTEEDPWPPYGVGDAGFIDNDLSAVIICGHYCLFVHILEEDVQPPDQAGQCQGKLPSTHATFHSQLLEYARDMDGPEEDFEEWLGRPFLPLLRKFHSEFDPKADRLLSDFFNSTMLHRTLKVQDDEVVAVACERDLHFERNYFQTVGRAELNIPLAGLPTYTDTDLLIIPRKTRWSTEYYEMPSTVRSVKEPDLLMAFEAYKGLKNCRHEIQTLLRLRDHPERSSLNIPDILGLVEKDGVIVGHLRTFIDLDETLYWYGPPRDGDWKTPLEVREQWWREIEHAMKGLHEMNLTWTGISPLDVLIDHSGKAWVTNFGGSWCVDWVDSALHGTLEGDVGGMERLKAYLYQGVWPPHDPDWEETWLQQKLDRSRSESVEN